MPMVAPVMRAVLSRPDAVPERAAGTAATATAALALLEEEVPHVVITELWLAGGMSGWALLRAIRSSAGSDDVVVIVITSFTSPEMMRDLFAADANGCILKPVFPDVLLRAASTARSGSVRDFFSIMPLQEPVSLGARLRAHP